MLDKGIWKRNDGLIHCEIFQAFEILIFCCRSFLLPSNVGIITFDEWNCNHRELWKIPLSCERHFQAFCDLAFTYVVAEDFKKHINYRQWPSPYHDFLTAFLDRRISSNLLSPKQRPQWVSCTPSVSPWQQLDTEILNVLDVPNSAVVDHSHDPLTAGDCEHWPVFSL